MRTVPPLFIAGFVACLGCGRAHPVTRKPEPPQLQTSYSLATPQERRAAQAHAMASMRWLIRTVPQHADPSLWKRARDLALDWIEAARDPNVRLEPAILFPVERDYRFRYGAYMRMAYLSGKTLYILEQQELRSTSSTAYDRVEVEVAAVEAMLQLYRSTQQSTEPSKSRTLERLARKRARSRLRAHVAKRLNSAGS